ncbi:MAG: hypothetical protein ACRD8Z_28590 [Nitrososphaeraceae archaeon]
MLQTWQHPVVFKVGFSNATDQSFGATRMIVCGTLPFAEGYFLMKFATCSLWFVFLHRFKSIALIKRRRLLKNTITPKKSGEVGGRIVTS